MHKEKLNLHKIRLINSISFLIGFSTAIGAYVLSTYFEQVVGAGQIGLYYFISYLIIQVIFFSFHRVVRKFGKTRTFYLVVLAMAINLLALSVIPVSRIGVALVMLYLVISSFCAVACDIMLECFSTDRMSGRIRGLNLTILNLGFLFGPLLSTMLMDVSGFQMIFYTQFVITAAIFFMIFMGFRDFNGDLCRKPSVRKMLVRANGNKNIRNAFLLSAALNFFFAIMVIYTPVYLRDLGISWSDIGKIFTIMLLPFVIIQYPLGILADKRTGEKELIIASLLIMAPAVVMAYYLKTTSILIWGAVLFATRIGAAMLELLTDSYFYKQIDGDDVELIDFYRSARSMGNIAAALSSWILLIFIPVKGLFVFLAFVLIAGLYPALRLKDSQSEYELAAIKKTKL